MTGSSAYSPPPGVLVALAAILWGLVPPVAQHAYSAGWSPVTLAAATQLAASPAALLAMLLYPSAAREALIYGLLLGAMRLAYLESVALNTGPVAAAALYTAPLIVALVERAGARSYLLASLAAAGVWLALGAPTRLTSGVLVAAASAAAYAALILYTSRVRSNPLHIAIEAQAAALIPLLPVCIATGCTGAGPWIHPTLLAAGPGVLAYALYINGVRRVGATRASIISTLEPVTATLVSLAEGARLEAYRLAGIAATITAVTIAMSEGRGERRG